MKLTGLHHVAAISSDLDRSADFYARVLGLAAHETSLEAGLADRGLAFGDELGRPGGILVLAERRGARRGRPGPGRVHRVRWRVASHEALSFWWRRLSRSGIPCGFTGPHAERLEFSDPDGLGHELVVDRSRDAPLVARAPGISQACALRGIDGVRALVRDPVPTADLLAGRLEFSTRDPARLAVEGKRCASYLLDPAPRRLARAGAGTVDHVAWSCVPGDQDVWRQRVIGMGARITTARSDDGRGSIYFEEPSGVRFEITAACTEPAALLVPRFRRGRAPVLRPA
jgi:glyoxalase family protein